MPILDQYGQPMETQTTAATVYNSYENPAVPISDPSVLNTIFGESIDTDSGVSVTPRSVMGYPAVWRAINLICSAVAKTPVNVYQRLESGGKQVARRHPAQRLFRRKVSPNVRASVFRKTIIQHALTRGNGYAAIFRNQRGDVGELLLLDPDQTAPVFADGEMFYATHVNGDRRFIEPRDVFHVKGLSDDGVVGIPVIEVLRDALGVGMAAQKYGGRYYKEGATASGVLMVPGHFDPEAVDNLLDSWNKQNIGLQNAHRVALLQDGAKFQTLTIDPEKSQFLQTREFEVRATVSNIFSIPPHRLGDSSRTSYNSIEAENQSLLDDAFDSWFNEFETEANEKFLSAQQLEADTHFVEFNRKALIRLDFKTQIEGLAKQIETGQINRNEAREIANLPGLGDDGERFFVPANWVPADLAGAQFESSPADESSDEEPEPEPDNSEMRARLMSCVVAHVHKSCQIERERIDAAVKSAKLPEFLNGDFYAKFGERSAIPGIPSKIEFAEYASESLEAFRVIIQNQHEKQITPVRLVEKWAETFEDRRVALVNAIMRANDAEIT